MASQQSRTFLVAILTLAAFVALTVWVMISPDRQEPAAADEAQAELALEPPDAKKPEPIASQRTVPAAKPPAPVAAVNSAEAPDPDAADLFAGEMPDFMTELHLRVLDKKILGIPQQKQLYDYGQEHKDDARPQLLLAWDAVNRDWDGIAIRMYGIAFRADARAKDDPTMLRDLLSLLGRHDRTEYREATKIIETAYGAEAVPRVDEEIATMSAKGKTDAVARLEKLKTRLLDQD